MSRAVSPEPTSSPTKAEHRSKVKSLASAILQIEQMLEPKYLKSPLGEDEKDKKKRLKEEEKKKKVRKWTDHVFLFVYHAVLPRVIYC